MALEEVVFYEGALPSRWGVVILCGLILHRRNAGAITSHGLLQLLMPKFREYIEIFLGKLGRGVIMLDPEAQ